MDTITLDAAPYTIRDDLAAAHQNAWESFAQPGTWLDGKRRLAVVAEVRQALECGLCRQRKEALSPYGDDGSHGDTGELTDAEVDLIHRLTTDSGRLRKAWFDEIINSGLSEGAYVEISGIVAMTMMADTFRRAIGMAPAEIPAAVDGPPSNYTPPGAKNGGAWVPLLAPEDVVDSDGPVYGAPQAAYVQRAFSSVPDTKRAYWALAEAHYLPGREMPNWETSLRAISRPQIEIIAARVSALHSCFY